MQQGSMDADGKPGIAKSRDKNLINAVHFHY